MSNLRDRLVVKALMLNKVSYFVEAWDETVYLQELSAKQMVEFFKTTYTTEEGVTQADPFIAMVNILYQTLVDEDGVRLFSKKELKGIGGMILFELGNKALELNDITGIASDKVKEELKKTELDASTSNLQDI